MSQRIQGEGEISPQDATRDLARQLLQSASKLLKLFSQNTSIVIPLMGITCLYFVMDSGRSSCSKRRLEAPRDPGDEHAGPSHCKAS